MTSLLNVFDIAGSGMSAQSLRLNTIASNLSNAETVAGSPEEAYKSRYPVFSTIQNDMNRAAVGVKVDDIAVSSEPAKQQYQPGHPQADKDGFVYTANVNVIEEMTNMVSASRSYQMNTQMLDTVKQLMMRTLQLGE